MSNNTINLIGWILFIISAIGFIISSIGSITCATARRATCVP